MVNKIIDRAWKTVEIAETYRKMFEERISMQEVENGHENLTIWYNGALTER